MGWIERAEAALAAARARDGHVVCPGFAVSPMDTAATQIVPGSVVDEEMRRLAAGLPPDADTAAGLPPDADTAAAG